MTTNSSIDPKELIDLHLTVLREYGRRVLIGGETLTPQEADAVHNYMTGFLSLGSEFHLTEKEMISHLYKGLFETKRGCDCPACRKRQSAQQ